MIDLERTDYEFRRKIKKQQYKEIWQQYCGFLDLSMNGYMKIQRRLMEEQVKLWSNCGLGQSILKGKHPQNLDEFRKMVPLTTYDDYADILLAKQPDMLPGNPVIWIQTTWEGGKHPIKVAPYTRSMLDTYRNNVTACLILSTSKEKGSFDVAATDKFLYALAPLPCNRTLSVGSGRGDWNRIPARSKRSRKYEFQRKKQIRI